MEVAIEDRTETSQNLDEQMVGKPDKEKIEKLYDHYKDTDSLRRDFQTKRNTFFVWICVLEAVSFLLVLKPTEVVEVISSGLNQDLKTDFSFGLGVIQTLIWILTIYVMIRYVQSVLYIERSYIYQDKIEKELTACGFNISREGSDYSYEYPMVLNFIDLFYKMFCPILFFILNIVHIVWEWNQEVTVSGRLIIDTALCISVEIITWFYFFQIHSKIAEWCKKHIPVIDKAAKLLRNVLKEV